MSRREFITLLGGSAVWPLAARAQQPALIGFLYNTTAAAIADRVTAFRHGLTEAGLVEGRNVSIEFRWAENHLDRLPALAADLVRRRVAVIVTSGQTTPAAKSATLTIPIVFISGGDPVELGLVTNLSRPGGNVTGVSFFGVPLNPKRFERLHELVPKPAIIAILFDPTTPTADAVLRDVEAAARMLGRDIFVARARTEGEINDAFAAVIQAGARALFVGSGAFFTSRRHQIVALAGRHALAASYPLREEAIIGGLMSYGASDSDAFRRAGIYVGRILKGERPGDLPVELPTKYELVFNVATAKALGINIPPTLLALADEIIE